jgi:hypothetical protein
MGKNPFTTPFKDDIVPIPSATGAVNSEWGQSYGVPKDGGGKLKEVQFHTGIGPSPDTTPNFMDVPGSTKGYSGLKK